MKEGTNMQDRFYNLPDLPDYLNELRKTENASMTKAALDDALREWMSSKEGTSVLTCKDCNTYSTTGIQDGYGWCKKFCFGPENSFFCLMAAPWEQETEADSEKTT